MCCDTSLPGFRTSTSARCHSVGVNRTGPSAPAWPTRAEVRVPFVRTSVDHGVMGSYAIVGAHLPIAAGAAWSASLKT